MGNDLVPDEPYVVVSLYWRPTYGPPKPKLKWRRPKLVAMAGPPKRAMLRAPQRYPFLGVQQAGSDSVLAVNALIPRGLVGREDVWQEILLAIYEGHITVDRLKSDPVALRAFTSGFRAANFECAGYARSLDAPLSDGRCLHDVLQSSLDADANVE